MRYYLGVGKYTALPVIEGDCDLKLMEDNLKIECVRQWNRCISMNRIRFNKKVFEYIVEEKNHSRWYQYVKCNLDLVNDVVISDNLVCNVKNLETKITEISNEKWLRKVDSKPKLRTYKCYKKSKGLEPYVLSNNLSKNQRSLICKWRGGCLPLKIETGRYNHVSLENRLCTHCNKGEIEDEVHFLLKCDLYSD